MPLKPTPPPERREVLIDVPPFYGDTFDYSKKVDMFAAFYLAGLTDGEGCFSIRPTGCSFIINLRDDDSDLLQWLCATFNVGTVTYGKDASADGKIRRPVARWTVSRKREVLWLTRVFDAFPLKSKKARDYAVWREAVIDWAAGSAACLPEYQAKLKAAREYVSPDRLPRSQADKRLEPNTQDEAS